MDQIHADTAVMLQGATKATDVHASYLDYQNKLRDVADMVASVWGGRAKAAFVAKHEEISSSLTLNANDVNDISTGTTTAANIATQVDDAAHAFLSAITGH